MTTETATITIETPESTLAMIAGIGDGELYEPALTIYPENDPPLCALDWNYGAKPGQATDAKIWHGRVLRAWLWEDAPIGEESCRNIPDVESVRAYLAGDEGQALLRRIVAGYETEWNGNNHVGTLTDDASEAYDALVARVRWDAAALPDGGGYWDATDWFDGDPPEVAASATDAELREMAERLDAEAAASMVVIGGTHNYLEMRRDEAREAAE